MIALPIDPRNEIDYDTFTYGTEPIPGDTTWAENKTKAQQENNKLNQEINNEKSTISQTHSKAASLSPPRHP